MSEPIRILNLFTIMNRGGAETMVMNYYRAIDRSKIQFDFMVHRQERGAYDDEIEAMGGRIFRMCPIYPQNLFRYQQMLKEFSITIQNIRFFIRICLNWVTSLSRKLSDTMSLYGFAMRMVHLILRVKRLKKNSNMS